MVAVPPSPGDEDEAPMVVARVEHLEIEGLAGPVVPGSWLSMVPEDESLGAFWLPLFVPEIRSRHQ